MYNVYAQNGDTQYNIMEYVVDTPDDIETLPRTGAMGSSALVISTSEMYMLNSEKEWVKI